MPPHRVCRVTRGRRCVVLCEGDRHLCHLCRPCRHDTEGGVGRGGGGIGKCAAARAVTWVSSHVSQRLNLYAICVMSQFPENVTLLLLNRCHVMLVEQPTTFGVPSWLEFLGMVHGFVKAAP